MADEEKIVQEVEIAGADEAASAFEKIGDAADSGFGKVGDAAEKANEKLKGAGDQVTDFGGKAQTLQKVGASADQLAKVEKAAFSFGGSLRDAGSAIGSFVGRVSALSAGAVGAVTGILLLARSISSATSTSSDGAQSTRALNAQLRASSQALTDMKIRAVTNERAISELTHSLATGKITASEYGKQLIELQRTQANEAEDARRIALIQKTATEDRLKALQKISKEQEAKQAFNDLVKKFGADLTSSLLRLGTASDSFWRRFLSGPSALARGVDVLTQVLQQNGQKILEFYNRIATAIGSIFDTLPGGDAVDTLSRKFTSFGEAVTVAIEQVIVPAIKIFLAIMSQIADQVNKIFGTSLSGEALILILIVAKLTGAANLLWASLRVGAGAVRLLVAAFGPWGLLIGLVIAALFILATKIDWSKLGEQAKQAADDVSKWFSELPGRIVAFFSDLWEQTKKVFSDGWASVVQLGTDAYNGIVNAWNNTVAFFSGIWDSIKQTASDAWDGVVSTIQSAVDKIKGFFQPVIDMLKSMWDWAKKAADALTGTGAAAANAEGFKGGGEVHGAGTSTSDSIWARLSRGEFVVRADAVRRYGVAALHAINQMRAHVPTFNMGGLVDQLSAPLLIPRLATGGPANVTGSASRPIILNIGDESFSLIAREHDTAERLGRFATKRRLGSSGRKPSYYGKG